MRRSSTIRNAFAEVIEAADAGAPQESEKENKPLMTTPKKSRRSAPTTQRSVRSERQKSEVEVLRDRVAALGRENESLKARVRARRAEKSHAPVAPVAEEEPLMEEEDRRWLKPTTRRRRTGPSARRSVGSVRSASIAASTNLAQPLAGFAVYGGAALDGECGARLPLPAMVDRYVVRPTELIRVAEIDDDILGALPTFALPDGVSLELQAVDDAVATIRDESRGTARVAALKSGLDGVVYLVAYVVPAAERFARPTAIHRKIRAAADLARSSSSISSSEDDPTELETSPLGAAAHFLPPPREEDSAAGGPIAVVGRRAYVALTVQGEACGACLRLLKRLAARDRRADVRYLRDSPQRLSLRNTRWTAAWDADGSESDDDEDAETQLGVHAPTRLASLVTRARDDGRVWKWLTAQDDAASKDVLRKNRRSEASERAVGVEEEKKVVAPPASMTAWAMACFLSLVPGDIIAVAVREVLRERSILVVAEDGARAAAVALGLAKAIAPLQWQGALIMTLPASEVSLLASPVPFIAGCSTLAAFVAHDAFKTEVPNPLADVAVLYVDRQHDAQFVAPTSDPPPPKLTARLRKATAAMQRGADVVRLLDGLAQCQISILRWTSFLCSDRQCRAFSKLSSFLSRHFF